ncbi:MAG: hypothetical protein DRO67_05470 [Candidatus Asgardarchaeum californiense]|nr:MAG: hypothetical protein DRO67_05470 [Candidatus Asgardarchaeum californiense]
MTQKLKLEFEYDDGTIVKFNKGKPFCVPKWTTGKHRAALAQLNDECSELTESEKNDEFSYYVVYQTLKQIDADVTILDLKTLHPDDLVALYSEVYNAGRKGIYFQESPKKKGKRKK